jgi:hypothetical protein
MLVAELQRKIIVGIHRLEWQESTELFVRFRVEFVGVWILLDKDIDMIVFL